MFGAPQSPADKASQGFEDVGAPVPGGDGDGTVASVSASTASVQLAAAKAAARAVPWMADPQNPHRMSWDFFVIIPLLIYLAVVMPFKVQSRRCTRVSCVRVS